MNSSVIRLLLISVCSILVLGQAQAAIYPLDECDVVLDSNNDEVPNAVVSSTSSTTGPYGNEVYSYSGAGSGLTISKNASGISGDTIRRIAFNLKVDSSTSSEELLFQFIDSNGYGLRVTQDGLNLQFNTTFKPDPTRNFDLLQISNFLVTTGAWNAFSLRHFDSLVIPPAFEQFEAQMNALPAVNDQGPFPQFVLGDLTVFQFDGALSCWFISVDENGATSANDLLSAKCSTYEVDCPETATTSTAEPTTTTTEPTTTTTEQNEPEPLTPWCSMYKSSRRNVWHLRRSLRYLRRRCRRCPRHRRWFCWQHYSSVWSKFHFFRWVKRSLRSSCTQ